MKANIDKEEAIKILNGYMCGKIDPESTELYHAIELVVDILESQPSLPSNLDEAAEEYARIECDNYVDEEDNVCYIEEAMRNTFKAGAKWMAGQGVTLNLSIDEFSCGAYNACVEQGLTSEDEVVVQIRKK